MDKSRRKRIRRLVGALNKDRKRQKQQIDILCNDMVSAHGDFVTRLRDLIFTVSFYESIIGCTDLTDLLDKTTELIQKHAPDIHISFFLLENEGFQLYQADNNTPIGIDTDSIENSFNERAVHKISASNWICSLDDMFEMGLTADQEQLANLSAAAIPLGKYRPGLGFILIYRNDDQKLTRAELERLNQITPGLSKAIKASKLTVNNT